ncbi:hypothetical protein [Providencia phage PSTCR9]|nr:hypothetical protein [Providencia phage PSTCR9]
MVLSPKTDMLNVCNTKNKLLEVYIFDNVFPDSDRRVLHKNIN